MTAVNVMMPIVGVMMTVVTDTGDYRRRHDDCRQRHDDYRRRHDDCSQRHDDYRRRHDDCRH